MGEAEENDLIWKNDSSSVEIRFQGRLEDGRLALDEVVATGADVHLEQMDHDQWWMGIEAGGRHFHLNFSLDDGRLSIYLSDQTDDQGEHSAEWEGPTIGRGRFQESTLKPVACLDMIIVARGRILASEAKADHEESRHKSVVRPFFPCCRDGAGTVCLCLDN